MYPYYLDKPLIMFKFNQISLNVGIVDANVIAFIYETRSIAQQIESKFKKR